MSRKKTVGEEIAVVQTEIKNIKTEIKDIKDSISDHSKTQREAFNTVFNKLDNLNASFAGKWVEKVTVGVLVAIVAGIVLVIVRGGSI